MIEHPPRLKLRRDFPRPTAEQVAAFRDVPTGFVADAMDGRGAMATAISPLPGLPGHVAGPALVADNGPSDILATLAAVHLVQPGDVVCAAADGFQGAAAAGDQLMGMMRNAGAAGFVTDGPMRDLEGIQAVGVPVWCTGLNANSPYNDGPGTVGGAASIGGVTVASGDIVVADENGVVVVPHARIDAVIDRLKAVTAAEEDLERKVADGLTAPLDLDAMLADGSAVEI